MKSRRFEQTISHYRIIEKIGQGGMGIVYKGIDEKLSRPVAIKFLPRYLSDEQEHIDRFVQEAKAASALDHPNICTIHEIDETEDGQLFIVMNYYEGDSLRTKIDSQQLTANYDDIVKLAIQIAEGLEVAHERGIIHRDIKPENIWVTPENVIKILDFGLAKIRGSAVTHDFLALGTLRYVSPEQLRGDPADERSDIWSFGIVLYEMLCGDIPFSGDVESALFYSILNDEPASLQEKIPDIPAALLQIVQKATRRSPAERYQKTSEILADLRAFSQQTVVAPITKKTVADTAHQKRKRLFLFGFIIAIVWLFVFQLNRDSQPPPEQPIRLAVLPFENPDAGGSDAYFADGITEAIISRISPLDNLEVIAKPSSDRFRQKTHDLPEIARRLNVSHIVTGSVRTTDSQIHINIQIINLQNETNVWSNAYLAPFDDIFAVQNDIARNVAEALQIRLKSAEQAQLARKPPENMEAYTLYLKGRYNWNQRTPESLVRALEFFQQATVLDSNFALAYTGIADALALFSSTEYGVMSAAQAMPQAKAAVLRAIRLAPDLAEAHTALANIKMNYDWDIPGAEAAFRKALSLNTDYATAHHWYAILLMLKGEKAASLAEIEIARRLDPVSAVINTEVGWLLRFARKYPEAVQQFKSTIKLDPQFAVTHVNLGLTYSAMNQPDSAILEFRIAEKLSNRHPMTIALLGYAYALNGQDSLANSKLAQLEEMEKKHLYLNPFYPAVIQLGLQNTDAMFAMLEKAVAEKSGYLIYLAIDPLADPLRENNRFREIVRKIGISQQRREKT
ncbi:MAG: protein kinase [Calditrichia bacterium]